MGSTGSQGSVRGIVDSTRIYANGTYTILSPSQPDATEMSPMQGSWLSMNDTCILASIRA